MTGGKRSGLKSAKGYGKRPGSAGWDDGSGQEGQRVWKQRRIPGHRLGRDHQAPSSVPGNIPGQSIARPQTLAQALIGYPRQTTLGAAWSSGENASLQTIPNHPTRKPDAHPALGTPCKTLFRGQFCGRGRRCRTGKPRAGRAFRKTDFDGGEGDGNVCAFLTRQPGRTVVGLCVNSSCQLDFGKHLELRAHCSRKYISHISKCILHRTAEIRGLGLG